VPNPYPLALRDRAVAAYETRGESYAAVAEEFAIAQRTLERWVALARETGSVAPREKGGGWASPVVLEVMHAVVAEKPDAIVTELTRTYNGRVAREHRVHRSSFLRALRRTGYVFKKNARGPRKPTDRMSAPSARPSSSGSPR
jgi:transposase